MPFTTPEQKKTVTELRDFTRNFRDYPGTTKIVALPFVRTPQFVDYEHALRSPTYIHERCKSDDECFLCTNLDTILYESKREKMIEEAGKEI